MKSAYVTGPDTNEWVEIPEPETGHDDVLLQIKACGICGSDAFYSHVGRIPPRQGATPLGHEPAAEVAEVGANVTGIAAGDHVVIASPEKYARIVSDTVPFERAHEALTLAKTPGAADKVVVTFE